MSASKVGGLELRMRQIANTVNGEMLEIKRKGIGDITPRSLSF